MKTILNYSPWGGAKSWFWTGFVVSLMCVLVAVANAPFQYHPTGGWLRDLAYSVLGQFHHLGTYHLWVNLAGMWTVLWGFGPWWGRSMSSAAFLGAGMLGVSAGLMLHPQVLWYSGLSGALHGVMVGGLWMSRPRAGDAHRFRLWWWALAVGFLAKGAIEWHWPDVLSDTAALGGPVLHAAHLWGALGGAMGCVFASAVGVTARGAGSTPSEPSSP